MTEKETEQNMLMEFIADTCKIDIDKKIDYPPVCLNNSYSFLVYWYFVVQSLKCFSANFLPLPLK